MSVDVKLQEALADFSKNETQTFPVVVTAVYEDKKLISGVYEDLEFNDIRLNAIEGANNTLTLFPKIGSKVLVSIIFNIENELLVVGYEAIDKQLVEIEDTQLIIDKNGFTVNSDGENLKKVMDDYIQQFGKLCDELAKVKVSIGTTPNVPLINQIKNKVTGNIKNRFNKILK